MYTLSTTMSRTKRFILEIEKPKTRIASRPNGGGSTHKDRRRKTRLQQRKEWNDERE